MNTRIRALLRKDFRLFLGNRFYLLITVVGMIFYIGAYFILPAQLDEKLKLAMYAVEVPPAFESLTKQEGVDIQYFQDVDSLKAAVVAGDYQAGIALPPDILEIWAAGGKPQISIYYSGSAASEISQAIVALVKELSYVQTGQGLNLQATEEVLGPDLLGAQIPLRDRLKPLLAVFILLVEILSLASLISVEIEQGTVRALLVTPMRVSELFLAKGALGIGLAFFQAVLFMLLVGGLLHQPLLMLITLILGSFLVVGIGFLLASLSRDVNSVTGWGILILIIMAIPGFGTAVPGLLSWWARLIPSFYLTDTISRVSNYGAGWGDVWLNLVVLTAVTAVVVWAGMRLLRRRYA